MNKRPFRWNPFKVTLMESLAEMGVLIFILHWLVELAHPSEEGWQTFRDRQNVAIRPMRVRFLT